MSMENEFKDFIERFISCSDTPFMMVSFTLNVLFLVTIVLLLKMNTIEEKCSSVLSSRLSISVHENQDLKRRVSNMSALPPGKHEISPTKKRMSRDTEHDDENEESSQSICDVYGENWNLTEAQRETAKKTNQALVNELLAFCKEQNEKLKTAGGGAGNNNNNVGKTAAGKKNQKKEKTDEDVSGNDARLVRMEALLKQQNMLLS